MFCASVFFAFHKLLGLHLHPNFTEVFTLPQLFDNEVCNDVFNVDNRRVDACPGDIEHEAWATDRRSADGLADEFFCRDNLPFCFEPVAELFIRGSVKAIIHEPLVYLAGRFAGCYFCRLYHLGEPEAGDGIDFRSCGERADLHFSFN